MANGKRLAGLKNILGTLMPTAGAMIGGPLGGMAMKAVAVGLGLSEDSSEASIEKALINVDPVQLKNLRKIDADLQVQLKELDIRLEDIAADDRDSARKREIALRDHTPAILAATATVGFFGILGAMFVLDIPAQAVAPLNIMLGGLIVMVGKVYNYYFGSSAGSAKKNSIIADFKSV